MHGYCVYSFYILILFNRRSKTMKQWSMARAAAILIILAAWAGSASAQYIDVPMDAQLPDYSHPNFASGAIVESVLNGEFVDPATWGGSVPGQGDTAVVKHDVALSGTVTAGTLVVANGGRVEFATTTSTDLRVGTLQIKSGGTVEIGNESTPIGANVTASITFRDLPVTDSGQYGGGLIILGIFRVHGATLASTFARLSTEPLIGDSVLVFESPVADWAPGDRLAIPDTRQLRKSESESAYVPQWEELVVASVSADGRNVSITAPLVYSHRGARDGNGVLQRLPHVMNLSRNVEFRSENPAGSRGYIIATDRAFVDVRYARFSQLGRTTNAPIDDTNIDARNPLRLLKLMGPTGIPAETPQFSLIGNAFDGGSAVHNYKWALGVDDSHYGLIADNVIYNAAGAGIAFYNGNETDNVLENNFVMRVIGTGLKYNTNLATRREGGMGACYWFRGMNNRIRDNVGANAVSAPDAGDGLEYDSVAFILSAIRGSVPNFKGADTSVPGEFTNVAMNTIPLIEFARNEFYGASKAGLQTDRVGDQSEGAAQINLLADTTIWHTHLYGYRMEISAHVVVDRMSIYGDPDVQSGIGVQSDLSPILDFQADDLNVQGMALGITLPTFVEVPGRLATGTVTLSNSYLRNAVNLEIRPIQRIKAVGAVHMRPRDIEVRNVVFESPATCRGIDIDMPYDLKDGFDTIQDDLIQVYDFNGIAADDFTLYFLEQHPQAIVPQTTSNDTEGVKIWGLPEAGLTNEQALATYGAAIGGRIASCLDSTTYPTIAGYTCNLSTGLGIDSNADSDGDGVPNISDAFPLDATKSVNTLEDCVIASNNNGGTDNGGNSSADNTSTNTTEFGGVGSLNSRILFWLILLAIGRHFAHRYCPNKA
jgi:hypothetical protein